MKANDFSNNSNNIQKIILEQREYILKIEDNEYNLKIEVDCQFIYFTLTNLDENVEFIYKNKMDLFSIAYKLELNVSKYSNFEYILKLFDNL